MKTPKYIKEALLARSRAAERFSKYDCIVSEFIEKHDIDCEFTHHHAEALTNPWIAARATIDAIEKHQEN